MGRREVAGDSVGDLLRHGLYEAGVRQAWLARTTGLTPKHVNQLIMGRARLTVEVAVRIEMAVPSISAEGLLIAQVRREISDYVGTM